MLEESAVRLQHHYVIVRADLPRGLQAAQIVHAAGESVEGPVSPGTHAVVLEVEDEQHLLHIAEQLHYAGIKHHLVVEPDLPTGPDAPLADGQGTAIGIAPTHDRRPIRRVLGRLPLLK